MKKIVGIFIVGLFVGVGFIPNISGKILENTNILDKQHQYASMLANDMTELEITNFAYPTIFQTMVYGPTMVIKNVGNAPALNVSFSYAVNGGFIIWGKSYSGKLQEPLEPGVEVVVMKYKFILGLGNIKISITASADNAPMVSVTLGPGILLLFFFFMVGYPDDWLPARQPYDIP